MEKKQKFTNALVSVSNKTGLVDFLKPLAKKGLRIVSTGGTAKLLKENGITVIDIKDHTGFPEIMDGRVKTLHPRVHMGLLARTYNEDDLKLLKEEGVEPFDLVIGNLYPFEEASQKNLDDRNMSEFIDIGGPSFLRASAKNYNSITVLCDPTDYDWVVKQEEISLDDRKKLAGKVFNMTSNYDAMIANQIMSEISSEADDEDKIKNYNIKGNFHSLLRYGENPQQKAVWFASSKFEKGLHQAEILQGKPLSYNNLLDLDAAVRTLGNFNEKCVVSLKHNNPCGVAVGKDSLDVLKKSLASDPVSVFGGIIALNYEVDASMAEVLLELFLECITAPKVSDEAKEIFSRKKNLRILEWQDLNNRTSSLQMKSVLGGYLLQTDDEVESFTSDWQYFSKESYDNSSIPASIRQAIDISWRVCANLKSNAIAIANKDHTVGLGMGQVNRVDAVEQSIARAKKFHKIDDQVVLASDAFFPFSDSIESIAAAGIKWVVQPGGSIKDSEVLEKAKELGVNIILTGKRHFKH